MALSGAGGRWTGSDGAAAVPPADGDWTWEVLDGRAGHDDPWEALCGAEVVVSHGGLNALAEVAAARRPTIVIPQPRPFAEQVTTARALQDAAIVTTVPAWPEDGEWPALLAAAARTDPAGWQRWSPGDGAARAAGVVRAVAAAGPAW